MDRTADVVVGTPGGVVALAAAAGVSALSGVSFVVVDEADLVLSYGCDGEAREALAAIPPAAQAMLVSATLDVDGIDDLRKVVLRRPLTVKVTSDGNIAAGGPGAGAVAGNPDGVGAGGAVHHYTRVIRPKDRYLITYTMLRLNVLSGKVLLFVADVEGAFRLKLFLDHFSVRCVVLNRELPASARVHCVEQFNAGIFDVLVATDEPDATGGATDGDGDGDGGNGRGKQTASRKRRGGRGGSAASTDAFGLARGIDFRDVAAVVNFDPPRTAAAYVHRAGRTARGGASGIVLTLVSTDAEQAAMTAFAKALGPVQRASTATAGASAPPPTPAITPLAFQEAAVSAFRYRVEDALRAVTGSAVRAARLADVRRELLNSDRLRDYFEDHPADRDALAVHDRPLASKVPAHLASIPVYLLPPALRAEARRAEAERHRGRGGGAGGRRGGRGRGPAADPLKSFSVGGGGRKGGRTTSADKFRAKRGIRKKRRGPKARGQFAK